MVTLRSSGFSSRMMRSMMLFSSLPSPLSCLSRWACPSDGDHGYAENTDITPELIAQLEQAAQQ